MTDCIYEEEPKIIGRINRKKSKGKHIKLRAFQLVANKRIPADKEPIA